MPTYNYKCESCNYSFSVIQSIKDDSLDKCEKCSGLIKRVIGGNFGLVFKGSGFYVTDYVKNKSKNKKETTKKKISKKENKK